MTVDYSREINRLVEYLNTCRDQYYNHNNSIITDKQYDDLFDRLKELEEESGIILSNSPTQSVGYNAVSSLQKVKHEERLLSLDKTKSVSDVLKFCGTKNVIFMHKMDGLTVDLTYVDGKITQALTRGGDDGYGEDITHNVKSILGIPTTIPVSGKVHISGEAIITYKDFQYINSGLKEPYKHVRNCASGSVRQFDSAICAQRKVRFITWNANDLSKNGTMMSGLDEADKLGFITVFRRGGMSVSRMIEKEIAEIFDSFKKRAEMLSYPIDGIVIMYDNIAYGKSLGSTAHHPRCGIAYKFYDETVESKLRGIEYSIGKTGVLTPVAIFDPRDIDGTSVSRASLSNISVLKSTLNVAFDGQTVNISKRNAVIPHIESADISGITLGSKVFTVPDKCPCCGEPTNIVTDSNSGVETLVCTNNKCSGRLLKKFSAFVSRSAMNIDGMSEKTLEKFIDMDLLNTYSDIFRLKDFADKIVCLDGFAEKSVTKMLDSIENAKNTTLVRLFVALNIDGIGKQTANDLSAFFADNPENVLKMKTSEIRDKLIHVDGFGETLVDSICKWHDSDEDMSEFRNLLSYITIESTSDQKSDVLNGLKFVITGSLETYRNRNDLISDIEKNGGKVQSSVSKETSYLINNDVNSTSGKNKKAKELGVSIISESGFVRLLNGDQPQKPVKKKGLF